jgi:hypothetical protein
MNSKWKLTSFSLGLAACLGTAAAGQAPGSGTPQYTVTDLGVLGKVSGGLLGNRTWFPMARNTPFFGMAPDRWWTLAHLAGPTVGRAALTCMVRPLLSRSLP